MRVFQHLHAPFPFSWFLASPPILLFAQFLRHFIAQGFCHVASPGFGSWHWYPKARLWLHDVTMDGDVHPNPGPVTNNVPSSSRLQDAGAMFLQDHQEAGVIMLAQAPDRGMSQMQPV